jgi:hypothetical protein
VMFYIYHNYIRVNHIGGLMARELASSVVDRESEPRSGQTKDYDIGICCFSAKMQRLNGSEFRIMCPNAATCIAVTIECWPITKWTSSSSH